MKRAVDVCGATLGLLLLWPLFLVIGAAIKLQDGGTVFFRQQRVGHRGQRFRMWKFRTMRMDAAQQGGLLTVSGDPRITRVGGWLRKHKLDELPQLFNVVAGQMSLVGPRPEVELYVSLYTRDERRVLELVPGITDPASIAFRNESELLAGSPDPERAYVSELMSEKIRLNLEYAAWRTVLTDLGVIVATLKGLLGREPRVAAHHADRAPIVASAERATARRWKASLAGVIVRHRRPLIVATHIVLISVAYLAAYLLRFNFGLPSEYVPVFWSTLPFLLAIRLAVFARYGLSQGYWQHAGLHDLIAVTKAATLSTLVFACVLGVAGHVRAVPRSVYVLDWMTIVLLAGGVRFAVRCAWEGRISLRKPTGRRVLIIGAGAAAERFIRLVRHDSQRSERILALVDDDPAKRGVLLHGVPVLGTTAELAELVTRHGIQLLVIAAPSAAPEQLRRIVACCLETKIEFKQLPPLRDLLGGRAKFDQLRPVELEHLLAREPVVLDAQRVRCDIEGRVVLVTGGAGSVGSELARQIARLGPGRLVLLDRAESALYFLQLELQKAHPALDLVAVVGDITDRDHLRQVFATHRPDHVFHAAAYKHVPLMEANIAPAIRNNVLGTLRVAQCAAQYRSRKFVLISTDKAVQPSSIMGATKRIAERIVLGWGPLRSSPTDFRAVRFGNVIGSDGSVVPLFKRQLGAGGPITVTHPDVERYFMTIPEAAQLVLQAAALPEAAGRITMLDMGEPVRILELAENLVRLSGLEPHRDVQIVFTGLRPGEKLQEDLMSDVEATIPTVVEKIRVVQTDEVDGAELQRGVQRLIDASVLGRAPRILKEIRALVPECVAPLREVTTPVPAAPAPAATVPVMHVERMPAHLQA